MGHHLVTLATLTAPLTLPCGHRNQVLPRPEGHTHYSRTGKWVQAESSSQRTDPPSGPKPRATELAPEAAHMDVAVGDGRRFEGLRAGGWLDPGSWSIMR